MKKQKIVVDNITYEVVATIHDDETNKNFVVFTDEHIDKNKGLKLSCVEYYEENSKFIPIKITDAREKEIAADIIKEVMEELSKFIKKK